MTAMAGQLSRRLMLALALEPKLNRDLVMRCIQSYSTAMGLRWMRVVRKVIFRWRR